LTSDYRFYPSRSEKFMKSNKNKKIKFAGFAAGLVAFVVPAVALAQGTFGVNSLQDLIKLFTAFNVDLLIPIAFSMGLLFFFWRGVRYLYHADSDEGKAEGRRILTWGVIALFCMASIWGIVKFLQSDIFGQPVRQDLPIRYRADY